MANRDKVLVKFSKKYKTKRGRETSEGERRKGGKDRKNILVRALRIAKDSQRFGDIRDSDRDNESDFDRRME